MDGINSENFEDNGENHGDAVPDGSGSGGLCSILGSSSGSVLGGSSCSSLGGSLCSSLSGSLGSDLGSIS